MVYVQRCLNIIRQQILEKCINDNEIKCIEKLKEPSVICVENIYSLLIEILSKILNYDKFKLELEENSSITEKFKALNDYSMNYSFKSLPYELDLIKNDSVLGLKRERWHKSLNKDFYIDEALNVLSDLRFSYLDN